MIKGLQGDTLEKSRDVQAASNLDIELEYLDYNRTSDELIATLQNKGDAVNDTNITLAVFGGQLASSNEKSVDLTEAELTEIKINLTQTYLAENIRVLLDSYPVSSEKEIKCTPERNLTSYWSFDDADTSNGWAIDQAEEMHNGSIKSDVNTGSSGVSGESYRFDGENDDYVDTTFTDNTPSDGSCSFAFWLKPHGDNSDSLKTLMRTTCGGNIQYKEGNKLQYITGDDSGNNLRRIKLSGDTIKDGEWQFISGTFNSGDIKLYYNGELKEEGSVSGTADTYNGDVEIGGLDSAENLHGKMDEVRIYNRTLSKEEFQRLMSVRDRSWAANSCKLAQ